MEMVYSAYVESRIMSAGGLLRATDRTLPDRQPKSGPAPRSRICGDLRDLPPTRDSITKFAMDQMQATQIEIALGTYPQDILADVG